MINPIQGTETLTELDMLMAAWHDARDPETRGPEAEAEAMRLQLADAVLERLARLADQPLGPVESILGTSPLRHLIGMEPRAEREEAHADND